MDTETQVENDAALASLAALTQWFDSGPHEAVSHFDGQDPGAVTAFLFGILASTIETFCEELELDPLDYIRGIAVTVAEDVYGIV